MIPFVDLHRQHDPLRESFHAVLDDVLDASTFVGGGHLKRFEDAFAAYCGTRFCIGVSNGTDALKLALLAAGVTGGREVIIPVNSFVATIEAVIDAGAVPVLADVDPRTGLLTAETVEPRLSPNVFAIIPVHLFGGPCDMAPLLDLAHRMHVTIIEDAAQAHGATYRRKKAGSFGAAGSFSFYPSKNLGALGDAGAIVTDSEELASTARMLRDHGQVSKYTHQQAGFNARLDTLQAAFLAIKLEHLDRWNETRRALADQYRSALKEVSSITPLEVTDRSESVFHLFVVRHPRRDELQEELARADIQTGIHYPVPVHLQEAYGFLGHAPGDFPVAESLAREMVSLPMFPELSPDEVEQVVGAITAYCEGNS